MKTFPQWHLVKIINPLGLFQETHSEENNYPNYPKIFFINIRDLPTWNFFDIKISLNGIRCIKLIILLDIFQIWFSKPS